MHYVDFALRLGVMECGCGFAEVVEAPGGPARCTFPLPVLADLDALMESFATRVSEPSRDFQALSPPDGAAGKDEPDLRKLGEKLFQTVFRGAVRDSFQTSLGLAHGRREGGLRVRLVFDLTRPGVVSLAALPWELLFHGDRGFLCRDLLTPVLRYVDVARPTELPPLAASLRVLAVTCAPRNAPRLDYAGEIDALRNALQDSGVALEVLRSPSLRRLRQEMRRGYHVLHFVGHGTFPPDAAEGALLFETSDTRASLVGAARVADLLRGLPSLRLVLLSACDGARLPRRQGQDPFTSVGTALVRAGVPAVVAMQFPIRDRAAVAFCGRFYEAFAAGDPAEAAVTEGRLAILLEQPESLHWATPVLLTRVAAADVLLPPPDAAQAPSALRERTLEFSTLVAEKTYGFVGRRFAFAAVDDFVRGDGDSYFEIVGEPGIGKTALVAQMVRDRSWIHHFNVRSAGIFRHEPFLSNVCAQLIMRHRLDYRELPVGADRDAGFLIRLLQEISNRLAGEERCVLLVDAVDEADRQGLEEGSNPLYLPPYLPAGIRIVLTHRPEDEEMLSLRVEHRRQPLVVDPLSAENLADAREYVATYPDQEGIRRYLARHGLQRSTFEDTMVERSAGNFMYLSFVLPALAHPDPEEVPLDEIPSGLRSYYQGHWQRLRGRTDREEWRLRKLPVLAAMTALDRPLTLQRLALLSGVPFPDVRRVMVEWRPFLTLSDQLDDEGHRTRLYRFYHRSFYEFLLGKDEVEGEHFSLREAEERIVKARLAARAER